MIYWMIKCITAIFIVQEMKGLEGRREMINMGIEAILDYKRNQSRRKMVQVEHPCPETNFQVSKGMW